LSLFIKVAEQAIVRLIEEVTGQGGQTRVDVSSTGGIFSTLSKTSMKAKRTYYHLSSPEQHKQGFASTSPEQHKQVFASPSISPCDTYLQAGAKLAGRDQHVDVI